LAFFLQPGSVHALQPACRLRRLMQAMGWQETINEPVVTGSKMT